MDDKTANTNESVARDGQPDDTQNPNPASKAQDRRDDFITDPIDLASLPLLEDADMEAFTESFIIPDTMHQIPWSPKDYAGVASGKTAHKLHSSAIAPIVAAARGYDQINEDNRATSRRRYGLPGWGTAQGRRLKKSLTDGDVMIMPWYTPAEVVQAQNRFALAAISAVQYRPEVPGVYESDNPNKPGREAKYEFVVGEETVVGLHPSTPQKWLLDSQTFIVAEGMLKADSLISAMLIASTKISDEDLLITDGANHQARLLSLLEKVEPEFRIPVLGIAGVYNWQQRHEWNALVLRNKEVWVAIDGDVSTNPNVHLAASRFWMFLKEGMKATPKLLAPEKPGDDTGQAKKMGVDDFLYEVGDFRALLRQLSDTLPKAPPGKTTDVAGQWRVSEDDCSVQESVDARDTSGNKVGIEWVDKVGLGGRIKRISESRFPSKREEATGVIQDGADEADEDTVVEVVVEVTWRKKDGSTQVANISGPHTFLNYNPDQWARNGANIPYSITTHPEWPPRGRDGRAEGWVRAVKSHREDEVVNQIVWQRMGWVPVRTGVPAFIIGRDVIHAEDNNEDVQSGVTEKALANADQFGVGTIDDRDFRDESYRQALSEDLRKTVKAYILDKPWTNPGVPGLIMAAALRPCIPIRAKGTVFIVGAPSGGKSYSAAAFMGFWARDAGGWSRDSLPGSAGDTAAAIELAMSRAPVWIVDDYHPTTDNRKAMVMHDKIADIVRYQFNGVSKRRATNVMGSMSVFPPNTSLLITGENQLNIASVRQRLVTIEMRDGALNPSSVPTTDLENLCLNDGAPSRVAQGLIKYMQYRAKHHVGGWPNLINEVRNNLVIHAETAQAMMKNDEGGSKSRSAGLFADYMITLQYLYDMALELGWSDEEADMFLVGEEGQVGHGMFELVSSQFQENRMATPGRSTLRAINACLSAGKAHVLNGNDHSAPPRIEGEDGLDLATKLGWASEHDGTMRARGTMIGYLIHHETGGPTLLLNRDNAFLEAQRSYPSIIPAGQTVTSSWQSVKDEKLISDEVLYGDSEERDKKKISARMRVAGSTSQVRGVPVRLAALLDEQG